MNVSDALNSLWEEVNLYIRTVHRSRCTHTHEGSPCTGSVYYTGHSGVQTVGEDTASPALSVEAYAFCLRCHASYERTFLRRVGSKMTTHDAFLADILSHPEDDAPRLIYADWLEENGHEERAELIRVQCRYAQLWCAGVSTADIRMHDLECREKELLKAHGLSRWVPDGWEGWVEGARAFRRGFIERLRMGGDVWVEHADALLAAQPVREVTLTSFPRWNAERGQGDFRAWLTGRQGAIYTAAPNVYEVVPALLKHHWPEIRRFALPTGLAPSPAGG